MERIQERIFARIAHYSSLLIVNLRERALLDERLRLATAMSRRARALGTIAVALGTPGYSTGEIRSRENR